MLALLLAGGAIYLVIGELTDALILVAFGMMSIAITFTQEIRTERVLEALRDLTSPRALVIRDGVRKRIVGRDVVRGDTVLLSEGDRVPADVALRESHDLQTDESLLTGKSVPVRKVAMKPNEDAAGLRPGGDDMPLAFSGSLVVRGSGAGQVVSTGPNSKIGKIGASLNALSPEAPRLRLAIRRLVWWFALFGGAVSTLAVILHGLTRGAWPDALLAGIALGMSMLPEEFPVVLTVFMARGAWRISKARVLTRRAAAIEALGSATVLCTDKTGTLTENRMSIIGRTACRWPLLPFDRGRCQASGRRNSRSDQIWLSCQRQAATRSDGQGLSRTGRRKRAAGQCKSCSCLWAAPQFIGRFPGPAVRRKGFQIDRCRQGRSGSDI